MMASTVDAEGHASHSPLTAVNGVIEKHLKGKQAEWAALASKRERLQLLDLPVDILETILRELTHTNDLTALALTHSALHKLVIPHIYSRFDIVWPDASTAVENRIGVDALTYGLATLVMGHDVFGEAPYQQYTPHPCQQCGHQTPPPPAPVTTPRKIRRGNYFAQYTRKFSLGNGPAAWVQEYLITKEGGKMLGTLVALAVGRMRNLEAFIWDMPTGVLRDVWLALASLATRDDGQECRLERVWVRWHDNQDQGPLASPPPADAGPASQMNNLPSILTGSQGSLFQIPPYPRVEFPTFSILPPLKSLSVLDMDELPYAEEMSVLIERSLERLQELRVGMAQHAQFDIWARPAEDRTLIPPPLMTAGDQVPRPGGVLGILVHRFCDAFSNTSNSADETELLSRSSSNNTIHQRDLADTARGTDPPTHNEIKDMDGEPGAEISASDINQLGVLLSTHSLDDSLGPGTPSPSAHKRLVSVEQPPAHASTNFSGQDPFREANKEERPVRKLRLEIFEVERVCLSVTVLSRAIDWPRLRTLTLLGCRNHEQLWKALRKRFTPSSRGTSSRMSSGLSGSRVLRSNHAVPRTLPQSTEDYPLNLKRLHTDTVSPALISFIKDTLAPDSLEWLFLQENPTYKSTVSIDMIYKGAVKRHRGSLTKLLIDSERRTDDETPNTNWRRWIYSRDLIALITGGKMKLRELSMSIDYKDWHFFLQRLPNATQLRALHIAHIAEHVHGPVDSREAALQVLDIVALKPELELCYLGVQSKCFEILEYSPAHKTTTSAGSLLEPDGQGQGDSDDNDDGHNPGGDGDEDSDFEVASSHGGESEDEAQTTVLKSAFRLREILFYEDKISIFRARHGRL